MPLIQVLPHAEVCPDGASFEVAEGEVLCRALLDHQVRIEHACELSCACTTCHVVIREGFQSLAPSEEDEDDLLDLAWGLTPTSRLSCQVKVGTQPLVLEIPRYTLNHAREGH